jgi:hypothetical protein
MLARCRGMLAPARCHRAGDVSTRRHAENPATLLTTTIGATVDVSATWAFEPRFDDELADGQRFRPDFNR